MFFAVAAGTDVGRVRKGNEDAYYAEANESRGLFIVADGMGGHTAGDIASHMTVETVAHDLAELNDLESAEAFEQVLQALGHANQLVYDRSHLEQVKRGMGTTASVLMLGDERFIIGHIGDSRIYLLRAGEFRQLTHDHSYVQDQLDAGLMTPEEARQSRKANMITRCIGLSRFIEPDILDGDVQDGDTFLLASDGLTGMVEDRRLAQLLSARATPARVVDALIAEANAHGGVDNITAVVIRIHRLPVDQTNGVPAVHGAGSGVRL